MKKKSRSDLYIFTFFLALMALIAMVIPGKAGMPGKSLKSIDSYAPLPTTTKLQQEREIAGFRETYVRAGDSLVKEKDYRKACFTYQKLLDILFKKSVDANFDVWMGAYGSLYKETDLRLKRAKVFFLENRRGIVAAAYKRKLAERIEPAAPPQKIIKRTALLKKGSLAVDGKLILTTFDTESPPLNSNHIIGVYDADRGEKLYDETPLPDDRKKPQINRWGGIYVMKDPQWSPDGKRYGYFINGALCVNDDGSGSPALISSIEDSNSMNDIRFWWSPDGTRLAYLRKEKEKTALYWNTFRGEKEQKIMEAENACFSSDSAKIAIVSSSRVYLHTLASGKTVQICAGDALAFSPDDNCLAVTLYGKTASTFSVSLRDLRKGNTRQLFNLSHPAFSRCSKCSISNVAFLSLNSIAFTILFEKEGKKRTDLWVCAINNGDTPRPLSSDGRTAMIDWLNSPTEVATERELLKLGR
jgi:hypothetical protein